MIFVDIFSGLSEKDNNIQFSFRKTFNEVAPYHTVDKREKCDLTMILLKKCTPLQMSIFLPRCQENLLKGGLFNVCISDTEVMLIDAKMLPTSES